MCTFAVAVVHDEGRSPSRVHHALAEKETTYNERSHQTNDATKESIVDSGSATVPVSPHIAGYAGGTVSLPEPSSAPSSTTSVEKEQAATSHIGDGQTVSESSELLLPDKPRPTSSKDRIQVVVRICPLDQVSVSRTTTVFADGRTLCVAPTGIASSRSSLQRKITMQKRKELTATFDRVLDGSSSQEDVYRQVRPCVRLPFLGVDACVFAYGQTGSGKSYTMMGTRRPGEKKNVSARLDDEAGADEPAVCKNPQTKSSKEQRQLEGTVLSEGDGVIPRAVRDIFMFAEERAAEATPPAGHRRSCRQEDGHDLFAGGARSAPSSGSAASSCTSTGTLDSELPERCTFAKGVLDPRFDERLPASAEWPLDENDGCLMRDRRGDLHGEHRPRSPAPPCLASAKAQRRNDVEANPRGHSVSVRLSYMQIYNGCVYDLLSRDQNTHPLPILDSSGIHTTEPGPRSVGNSLDSAGAACNAKGQRSCAVASLGARGLSSPNAVAGLSVHPVDSFEQTWALLTKGDQNRRVRATEMNANSSRSHCIVQFIISNTTQPADSHLPKGRRFPHRDSKVVDANSDGSANESVDVGDREGKLRSRGEMITTCARLSLIDLAGSEKGGIGPPGGEGQELERTRINSSLSALGHCISCLGDACRSHVPFRDNPLTRLLQSSLSSGKTFVIATINPSVEAQAESITTLKFAARCMRVVVRQRVNEVVSDGRLLERARRQIAALRRRLREFETANSTPAIDTAAATHTPPDAAQRERGRDRRDVERGGFPNAEPLCASEVHQKSGRRLSPPSRGESFNKATNSMRNAIGLLVRESPLASRDDAVRRRETAGAAHSRTEGSMASWRRQQGEAVTTGARAAETERTARQSSCVKRAARAAPMKLSRSLGAWVSSKQQGPGTAENEDASCATVALMERFSHRERELLRELDAWKTRCRQMSDQAAAENATPADASYTPPPDAPTSMASPCADALWSSPCTLPSQDERQSLPSRGTKTGGMSDVKIAGDAQPCTRPDTIPSRETDHIFDDAPVAGRDRSCCLTKNGGDQALVQRSRARAWATALSDIAPKHEGDLQLREGQDIQVISRREGGRWHGRLQNGAEGLFPRNYVQVPAGSLSDKTGIDRGSPVSAAGTNRSYSECGREVSGGGDDGRGGKGQCERSSTVGRNSRPACVAFTKPLESSLAVAQASERKAGLKQADATDRTASDEELDHHRCRRHPGVYRLSKLEEDCEMARSQRHAGQDLRRAVAADALQEPPATLGGLLLRAGATSVPTDLKAIGDQGTPCGKVHSGGPRPLELVSSSTGGREGETCSPNHEAVRAPSGILRSPRRQATPDAVSANLERYEEDRNCSRHGLPRCVLCGNCSAQSPVGSAHALLSSGYQGDPTPPVWPSASDSCKGPGSGSIGSRAASLLQSSGAPTQAEPCQRHDLLDCILCKIRSRSIDGPASLSALGSLGGSGVSSAFAGTWPSAAQLHAVRDSHEHPIIPASLTRSSKDSAPRYREAPNNASRNIEVGAADAQDIERTGPDPSDIDHPPPASQGLDHRVHPLDEVAWSPTQARREPFRRSLEPLHPLANAGIDADVSFHSHLDGECSHDGTFLTGRTPKSRFGSQQGSSLSAPRTQLESLASFNGKIPKTCGELSAENIRSRLGGVTRDASGRSCIDRDRRWRRSRGVNGQSASPRANSVRRRQSKGACADMVSSAARDRERKGGVDDFVARAMTAALAVL